MATSKEQRTHLFATAGQLLKQGSRRGLKNRLTEAAIDSMLARGVPGDVPSLSASISLGMLAYKYTAGEAAAQAETMAKLWSARDPMSFAMIQGHSAMAAWQRWSHYARQFQQAARPFVAKS
jgi:hypothetical protein